MSGEDELPADQAAEQGATTHKELRARLSLAALDALASLSAAAGTGSDAVLEQLILREAARTGSQAKLQAAFEPQTHLREAPVVPGQTALLFIDVQNFNCHRQGSLYRGQPAPENAHWWQRMEQAQPLWQALLRGCRAAGVEVLFTVMQSLTADGRDRSLDYKISGFHVPPGSFDAEVLACIQPGPDEILVPKTSSSVFTTTAIDRLLRNLDCRCLILAGCLTDQCVESAVRDACDLGYLVTLVTDACATYSQERHDNSLRAIRGYCRQRTTTQLLEELASLGKEER